ncbi:MAG: hypothetical protein ACE5H5_04120 [Nitrospinota bacterium]
MADTIYGYCERCEAPIFFEVTLDPFAYKVHAYRCWNGHYGKLTIEHCSPMPRVGSDDNVVHLAPYLAARPPTLSRRARR